MYRIYRPAVVLLLLAIAGCSAANKPKREYAIMKESGASGQELCGKAREIAAAYLSEDNDREYLIAKISADEQCERVALQNGY